MKYVKSLHANSPEMETLVGGETLTADTATAFSSGELVAAGGAAGAIIDAVIQGPAADGEPVSAILWEPGLVFEADYADGVTPALGDLVMSFTGGKTVDVADAEGDIAIGKVFKIIVSGAAGTVLFRSMDPYLIPA